MNSDSKAVLWPNSETLVGPMILKDGASLLGDEKRLEKKHISVRGNLLQIAPSSLQVGIVAIIIAMIVFSIVVIVIVVTIDIFVVITSVIIMAVVVVAIILDVVMIAIIAVIMMVITSIVRILATIVVGMVVAIMVATIVVVNVISIKHFATGNLAGLPQGISIYLSIYLYIYIYIHMYIEFYRDMMYVSTSFVRRTSQDISLRRARQCLHAHHVRGEPFSLGSSDRRDGAPPAPRVPCAGQIALAQPSSVSRSSVRIVQSQRAHGCAPEPRRPQL